MEHITRRSVIALGAAALGAAALPAAAFGGGPTVPSAASRKPGERGDDRPPPTPYLVIPYTVGDTGARPLAAGLPFWHCDSVRLDGSPFNGSPLEPGVQVQLSAVVANLGALAATTTVRFYWASPTTAFTAASMNLIGSRVYTLPGGTALECPTVPFVPGGAQPEHFCLFVEATTVLDAAPGTFDPVGDRHYAQQNLQRHPVSAAQELVVPFFAVGTTAGGRHEVSIEQFRTSEKDLTIPEDHMWLKDLETGDSANTSLRLELEPDQRRALEATIVVPSWATADSRAVVALVQRTSETEPEATTGALGIELHVK